MKQKLSWQSALVNKRKRVTRAGIRVRSLIRSHTREYHTILNLQLFYMCVCVHMRVCLCVCVLYVYTYLQYKYTTYICNTRNICNTCSTCMYVYAYIYMHTYIHKHTLEQGEIKQLSEVCIACHQYDLGSVTPEPAS